MPIGREEGQRERYTQGHTCGREDTLLLPRSTLVSRKRFPPVENPETFAARDVTTLRPRVWWPRAGRAAGRGIIAGGGGHCGGSAAYAKAAAVSGPGQTRDFPFHERGAVARRYFRPQAAARPRRWEALPRFE